MERYNQSFYSLESEIKIQNECQNSYNEYRFKKQPFGLQLFIQIKCDATLLLNITSADEVNQLTPTDTVYQMVQHAINSDQPKFKILSNFH